jgi:ubiquinone biosynthesis protein Coq4
MVPRASSIPPSLAGEAEAGSATGVRWEEGLDKPVDAWRKELGIEPIRHAQNSW